MSAAEPFVADAADAGDDPRSETRARRVSRAVAAEVRWARDASHAMCFAGPFEPSWNLLYWVLILAIMACVLPGRWVHIPFGQGGPVRPDETAAERIARVNWVYATDGPFALMALVDAGQLLVGGYDWSVSFALALEATYVLGNVVFLRSMRKRNALQVRIGIVANNTFAIGMAVLLVEWAAAHRHAAYWDRRAWLLVYRTILVLFYLCVSIDYAPLWREYELLPDAESAPLNFFAALANASAAILVLALLFTAAWDPSAEKVVFDAYLS